MFGLPGHMEILILLVIILIIFGPKNLPKLGSAMGGFVRNLREGKEGQGLEEDDEFDEKPAKRSKSKEDE